jgi:2-methylisocitrate lyase-like PEP mutase family enzyme
MDRAQQQERATSFLARHRGAPVLLLPNVWDAMSAKLFVEAGFDALGTTSGGVAWALGYPDGEAAPWSEVVAATARIVRCANVPVTADIEAGYGQTPAEVGAHVAEIIRAGAIGVNLEDGWRGALRSTNDMIGRLQAARQAAIAEGVPIVLNARCDVFHLQHGDEGERLAIAIERTSRPVRTASTRSDCAIHRSSRRWSRQSAVPSISPAGPACPMRRSWRVSAWRGSRSHRLPRW